MTARVLTGSKQEIAEKVAEMEGDVREVIVFVEDVVSIGTTGPATFEDMEPFTVRQPSADDSRDALYERMEGE